MRLEGWEGAGGLNSSDFECLGEQRGTLSQVPSQSLLCRFWRKKKFQGPPPGLAGADTDQRGPTRPMYGTVNSLCFCIWLVRS